MNTNLNERFPFGDCVRLTWIDKDGVPFFTEYLPIEVAARVLRNPPLDPPAADVRKAA